MPTLTDRQRRFLPLAAIPAILLLCGLPWFWFYHSRIEPQQFRISTGQWGGAYHPLFRHFGLPDEAFTAVYSDMSEGCSKLLNEEVDAVLVVAGVHAPAIRDVMASGRVRLIGIGEYEGEAGEIHGFQLHCPDIEPYTLPIGTYPSSDHSELGRPRDPIRTVSVPSVLVCSAEVDEVVVNQITRSIFENRTPLAQKYPIMGQISEPASATSLAYPLHQGAEAYFRRDEPSFLVNYAEVVAFLLSVVISLWGAVLAFRNWLTLRKKDRIDEYYVRIDELLSRLHGEESIPVSELHAMEQELSLLRHRAVQELVAERLIANESFRIFQTLLSNSQAEVRRQLEKEN